MIAATPSSTDCRREPQNARATTLPTDNIINGNGLIQLLGPKSATISGARTLDETQSALRRVLVVLKEPLDHLISRYVTPANHAFCDLQNDLNVLSSRGDRADVMCYLIAHLPESGQSVEVSIANPDDSRWPVAGLG